MRFRLIYLTPRSLVHVSVRYKNATLETEGTNIAAELLFIFWNFWHIPTRTTGITNIFQHLEDIRTFPWPAWDANRIIHVLLLTQLCFSSVNCTKEEATKTCHICRKRSVRLNQPRKCDPDHGTSWRCEWFSKWHYQMRLVLACAWIIQYTVSFRNHLGSHWLTPSASCGATLLEEFRITSGRLNGK